jgi:hypothetical protein
MNLELMEVQQFIIMMVLVVSMKLKKSDLLDVQLP